MKQLAAILLMSAALLSATVVSAQQDKSKRASPPAKVIRTIATGATISIDYSQPSIKGRVIGEELEPKEGKVWRMGANEATVFETDRNIKVMGQDLPAGKYSLFGIKEGEDFTIMFNREWNIWGTRYEANKDKNALTIKTLINKSESFHEKLTYTITMDGLVSLFWGDIRVDFTVQ